MRLVAEWRRVLRCAWSIRLLIIAGVLSGAEIGLPLIQDLLPIPRGVFAGCPSSPQPAPSLPVLWLSNPYQETIMAKTKTRLVGALGAATVAGSLAVQTVGGFEGLKLYAYRDVIGVWTACYGETAGIKPGMKFSKATCDNMLVRQPGQA